MDFQSDKTRRHWDMQALGGVGIVCVIIVVDYYLFNFVFIPHLYSKASFSAALICLWIQACVGMLVWSYYKVCRTGPGFLSPHINEHFPNVETIKQTQKLMLRFKHAKHLKQEDTQIENEDLESELDIQNIKRLAANPHLQIQETGYCFKCNRVKLPRTHHCRICGRCVIRMDHHCPWTGNCIGLYNQKYFILFLVYASTTLGQIAIIQSLYMWTVDGFQTGLNENDYLLILVGIVMSFALTLSIGFLGGFQLYIGMNNLTTVENHIKDLHRANPFNKGTMRNFEDIFGTDKSTWMWPIAPKLQSEEYLFLLKNY